MPKAPEWFLRELKAFDSLLRVRWSVKRHLWQLERKVLNSLHPGTIKCEEQDDDVIRAREGYLLVGVINPGMFSRTIFDKLRASDLWANGGWQAMVKKIEEAEDESERLEDEAFAREIQEQSADVYDMLKIRDGRSVYSAGWV